MSSSSKRNGRARNRELAQRPLVVKSVSVPADEPGRGVFYGPQGQRWSRVWFEWRTVGG